ARGHAASVTALSPAGFFGTWDRAHPLGLLSVLQVISRFSPNWLLRAICKLKVGRVLTGMPLYAYPDRKTADDAAADAIALGTCGSAFFRTVKSGLTYRFESEVDVPATVAWGTKDRILLYRQSHTAKTRLPNATHVPLQGAGHVPMTDEPDLIAQLVDETVARVSAVQAA
ncbi:MAG TPA: alpha/beta hydrolase, partial [Nocardioidaceae bacterium]|nr:alpha/beta hydrolase [Nocardioidaceae bacterium]